MESMEIGELIILALETLLASLCLKVISVFITVILYGRMIEIYLYSSIGAIPFATMSNREWGQIGSNYLRGLFALAFQGFFYHGMRGHLFCAGCKHTGIRQCAYGTAQCNGIYSDTVFQSYENS